MRWANSGGRTPSTASITVSPRKVLMTGPNGRTSAVEEHTVLTSTVVENTAPAKSAPENAAPGGGIRIGTFVALGDSFTEGMVDTLPDGSLRGWADLVAGRLSRFEPGFRYANLAVRGPLDKPISADQVPVAGAKLAHQATLAAR